MAFNRRLPIAAEKVHTSRALNSISYSAGSDHLGRPTGRTQRRTSVGQTALLAQLETGVDGQILGGIVSVDSGG